MSNGVIARIKEDIRTVFRKDPAARNVLEVRRILVDKEKLNIII